MVLTKHIGEAVPKNALVTLWRSFYAGLQLDNPQRIATGATKGSFLSMAPVWRRAGL